MNISKETREFFKTFKYKSKQFIDIFLGFLSSCPIFNVCIVSRHLSSQSTIPLPVLKNKPAPSEFSCSTLFILTCSTSGQRKGWPEAAILKLWARPCGRLVDLMFSCICAFWFVFCITVLVLYTCIVGLNLFICFHLEHEKLSS